MKGCPCSSVMGLELFPQQSPWGEELGTLQQLRSSFQRCLGSPVGFEEWAGHGPTGRGPSTGWAHVTAPPTPDPPAQVCAPPPAGRGGRAWVPVDTPPAGLCAPAGGPASSTHRPRAWLVAAGPPTSQPSLLFSPGLMGPGRLKLHSLCCVPETLTNAPRSLEAVGRKAVSDIPTQTRSQRGTRVSRRGKGRVPRTFNKPSYPFVFLPFPLT